MERFDEFTLPQLQYLAIEGNTSIGYIWQRHFRNSMSQELGLTEIVVLEPINNILMVPT